MTRAHRTRLTLLAPVLGLVLGLAACSDGDDSERSVDRGGVVVPTPDSEETGNPFGEPSANGTEAPSTPASPETDATPSAPTSEPPAESDEAKAAVESRFKEYLSATAAGEGATACGFQTKAYTDHDARDSDPGDCLAEVKANHEALAEAGENYDNPTLVVLVTDADHARVSVAFPWWDAPVQYYMVRQDGEWLVSGDETTGDLSSNV